jgi:glycosyltransferase involved in cell wall biosynthesis
MRATAVWAAWDVQHIPTHRNGTKPERINAFASGASRFLWVLVTQRPALVHLHMSSYGSFARKSVLAWIARGFRVPVVIHVHGSGFHDFVAALPWVLRAYARATLTSADVVVALGDTWARRLEEIAPRARVVAVPNGVMPHSPVAQPPGGERVRVLFLGEISAQKGTFVLLDAWQQVMRSVGVDSAELWLAGGGDLEQARRHKQDLGLGDEVQLLGWVPPEDVEALLHASQVLTLPSFQEGQPMAVLEAMARGLCVVASNVGGIPDLIDEDSGILVPAGDVAALATALAHVITDEAARVRLGCRALNRVRTEFDVAQTGRALDVLYRQLIS